MPIFKKKPSLIVENPGHCALYRKRASMSYKLYDIEDFAGDPAFRSWVLHPDKDSNYFWERWIIDNPEKKESVKKAILLVRAIHFDELDFSTDDKKNLLARIDHTLDRKSTGLGAKVLSMNRHPKPLHDKRRQLWISFAKYAAAIALLVVVAYSGFIRFHSTGEDSVPVAEKIILKEISKGQKMKIFLPDGSIVIMNASSRLSYPERFTGATREVQLAGEAFFEVAKDTVKPFIVRTTELTARALGTSFNVRSYPDSDIASVALVTGKALVNRQGSKEQVTLEPGESAGLNKKTGLFKKVKFDYNEEICWKDGILYFRETDIREVFKELEQWYGVSIHVEWIPLNVKPINGSFDDEYLKNVLLSIGHAVDFEFTINGNEVYVKFKQI